MNKEFRSQFMRRGRQARFMGSRVADMPFEDLYAVIGYLLEKGGEEVELLSANPFQHHRRVLFLFVAVVSQDGLELCVRARIDALVVPIHGFELLHQRRDRTVHVERGAGEQLPRFVKAFACH